MPRIGENHAARIHMRSVHSYIRKYQRDQTAGKALAVARERIDGFGSEFAFSGQLFEQVTHLAKMAVENLPDLALARRRKQRADFALMHLPDSTQTFERPIFLSGS